MKNERRSSEARRVTVAVRGGGCLSLGFGLPPLFFGLAGIWFALHGQGSLLFPAFLVLAGFLALLGRKVLTIDGKGRTLEITWGVFGVGKTQRTPLGDPQAVTIDREQRGVRHRYSVYAVRVVRQGGEAAVIDEPDDPIRARRVGELVAKVLQCRLADHVDGTKREANELDRTLRDVLRARVEPIRVPDRETSFCTQHEPQDRADVITFPRVGLSFGVTAFLLIGVLMSLGFGIALFIDTTNRHPLALVALCLAAPVLMFSLPAALVARSREVVTVSSRELVVATRGLLGTSGPTVPFAELEELISSAHRLTAISDQARISFGHRRLTVREVAWLRAVIERAVAAPDASCPANGPRA
jgi:hypothetical protein